MLEGNLLNEVGMESITDIHCPTAHFSITATSTIPKIPSHSKFLHLESNMLSPVQSNRILLPLPTETSTRRSIRDDTYVKPPPPNEQENEDIKKMLSVDGTMLVSMAYKDHNYCLKEVDCSKNKDGNVATRNLLPLQSCSQLTNNYSKACLKTVGLTNINLETLADTHSISLSVYEVKVNGATAQHEERVKLRRKDFLKVMKIDKIINKIKNDTYLDVTEMKCKSLDGNTTMRQIEFITDLMYCVNKLPDGVLQLLSLDPKYSIKNSDAVVTGFDEVQGKEEQKQTCKDHRLLLTKRMASVSPTLKDVAQNRSTYLYDNPPAVEKSRSISFINKKAEYFNDDSKQCATTNHDNCMSSQGYTEGKKTCDKNDISTRQLRSRKIWLTLHSTQKKTVGCYHQTDAKDVEVKPSELSRKYDEEFVMNNPTEMLKEWISISERWLRESLDVESMLMLI